VPALQRSRRSPRTCGQRPARLLTGPLPCSGPACGDREPVPRLRVRIGLVGHIEEQSLFDVLELDHIRTVFKYGLLAAADGTADRGFVIHKAFSRPASEPSPARTPED
jgi:hypothetical protein